MARNKQYVEEEVINKAMQLFWENGYDATSVRMLEREMGINQFSIYASFRNKQGVFLESIKCYKKKIKEELLDKLNESTEGIEAIKQYFYNFIEFSKNNTISKGSKGCLLTNTINELGQNVNQLILSEITNFATNIRAAFVNKLKLNTQKNMDTINKQANYLIVALQGLSVSSKIFGQKQLEDFIEGVFERL